MAEPLVNLLFKSAWEVFIFNIEFVWRVGKDYFIAWRRCYILKIYDLEQQKPAGDQFAWVVYEYVLKFDDIYSFVSLYCTLILFSAWVAHICNSEAALWPSGFLIIASLFSAMTMSCMFILMYFLLHIWNQSFL